MFAKKNESIILQNGGSEWIDNIDDELISIDYDERFDIMRVYRDPFDNSFDFIDYVDGEILFDRDSSWVNPLKIESERDYEQQKQSEVYFKEMMADCITVLAQGYYGNRTLVTVKKEKLNKQFLAYHPQVAMRVTLSYICLTMLLSFTVKKAKNIIKTE